MGGGRIDQRVHGIESEAVEVVVAQPHQRVVAEEPAHLVAAGAVEVDRVAPRRVVAVGEVRPKLAKVIPLWSEVVVDDVEDHGEPAGVTRVDKPLQIVRRPYA